MNDLTPATACVSNQENNGSIVSLDPSKLGYAYNVEMLELVARNNPRLCSYSEGELKLPERESIVFREGFNEALKRFKKGS